MSPAGFFTARSRRAGRRRLGGAVALVALVPASLLVGLALASAHTAERGDVAPTATGAASPLPSTATPILSARRLPGLVSGHLATQDLVPALGRFASTLPAPSCLTVAVDGATVFDARGEAAVVPASNLKLLTAAVAWEALGPDHRFTTTVRQEGDTVYLVGGGDPVLATAEYLAAAQAAVRQGTAPFEATPDVHTAVEPLADAVAAAGVRSVSMVVGDDSRYDAERYPTSWLASYGRDLEAGPLGALMIDDAFSSFTPRFRASTDPAANAAARFATLLRDRGVAVAGSGAGRPAPATARTVARVQSPPLRDLVAELLVTSDNNTAELLLKEIGKVKGTAGTRAAGLEVERAFLGRWGLKASGLNLVDGSGLDRGNRLTCRALLGVLDHAAGLLTPALPVAAQTGTLAPLFKRSPMAGRLRAKTGTLTGVKALSGYVPSDGGHTLSFAFVYNGTDAGQSARALFDGLGHALATYPFRPDLSAFGPRS
jgi:D-alanyl-D-alanine carboxypeptidase/D-alanyl-D-alanine-endopeptidase (penicillin-binding protein 4)